MGFQIRYSTRAYIEYETILEYVSEKFGISKAIEVDNFFEQVMDQISINSFLFPVSEQKRHKAMCY